MVSLNVSTMQQHGILDNGEAKPRSTHFATTAFVYAIETLEDTRQML